MSDLDPFGDEEFLSVNSSGRINSPALPLSAVGGESAAADSAAVAGSAAKKEKKKSKKSKAAAVAADSHAFDPDDLDLLGAFGAPTHSSSSSSHSHAAGASSSVDAVPVLKTFGSGGGSGGSGGGSAVKKSKSKSASGGDGGSRSPKVDAFAARRTDLLSEPVVDEAHSKASLDDFFGGDDEDEEGGTVGHAQGKIGGGYASVGGSSGPSPPVLSGGGGSGSSKHPKSSKKVSKKVAKGGFAPVGAELDAPPGADDDPEEEDLEADARSMAAQEARMAAEDAGGSKPSLKRWMLIMALLLLASLVVWQTGLLSAPVVDGNGNAVEGTQVTDDSLGTNDTTPPTTKQPEGDGDGALNSDQNLDAPTQQQQQPQPGGSVDSNGDWNDQGDQPPSGGSSPGPTADLSLPVAALPGPDAATDTSNAETLKTVGEMEKRDEKDILLDAAKAAAQRDNTDSNQVVEADAGKADAAKDAARALEEEKKKQRAAAATTGGAAPSSPFETAMAQLQLAQLRAGMDAISGLSNRTSLAAKATPADIARCTEKARFEVTIDGLDTLSDQKLTPWAVHTLRIRRVQPTIKHVDPDAPQPQACIGDSFHVWLRRAPEYVTASDKTHPLRSPLPGVKGGMPRKRLDLFPLDLSESMEGGYSRNIYSDAWSLPANRVVPDSSQYFPVFLERVSLPSDDLGPEREEILGTFFVGEEGLYRLDVMWLGTLFEDHADPRFADTDAKQPPAERSCPAGARALPRPPGATTASQPTPRYFRVDPPVVQDSQKLTAQQLQDLKLGPLLPQTALECTRRMRTGLGFFSGTQFRPLDCHPVNFDLVNAAAAKAPLHGFPGAEWVGQKGPHSERSFKPQKLEVSSCPSLAELVGTPPSDANLWVLFVGDSTMRGLFQDSVDLVLDEETPREHAQDALRNVYDLPEANLRLEYVEWVLSSETALPLRGVDYAPRGEGEANNVAPSGDATRVPDVVVFSSGMLDVSHFALADYESSLTRVLKGLATWVSKRSADAAAAPATAGTTPPSMPRFVWVTPPAQIQFAAQGGLGNASTGKKNEVGKRMRALGTPSATATAAATAAAAVATAAQPPLCPTGTYSRTSAAAFLSRQLLVSLAPFISQVDMHALTSMRLDLGIDGRYEKLFAPPGGFVSRMTTQLLWTQLCALDLEDPSDPLAAPVRQLIAEEVAAEVEEVQLKVDAGESVANATREVAREHASATAAASTGSGAATADDAEEPSEADVDKEAERITEASAKDSQTNNLSSVPKGNDAIVAALRALDKSKPPKCFLDLPPKVGSGRAAVLIKQDPSVAVLHPKKGDAPLCRASADADWFGDYVSKCLESLTPAASGALPTDSKFLVYSCVDSDACSHAEGLADHLLQIVYGFLLAFTSDRTFVLDMPDTAALFSVPTTTTETLARFRAEFAAFKNGTGDATKAAENAEQILYFNFQREKLAAASAMEKKGTGEKQGTGNKDSKRLRRLLAIPESARTALAVPPGSAAPPVRTVAPTTPASTPPTPAAAEGKILFHQFYTPRSAKGAFVDFATGTGKDQVDSDPASVNFANVWGAHRYVVLSPPTLGGTKLMGLLWSNKLISTKLQSVGLTPESSFGCLLNLLLRPTAAPLRRLDAALPVLLDPHAFVVGIQGTFNEGDLPPVPPVVPAGSAELPVPIKRGGSSSNNHPAPAVLDPFAMLRAREAKAQQIGLDLPLACASEIYQSWLTDSGASVSVDSGSKSSIVPAPRPLRYFFLSTSRLLRNAMVRRETEAAIVLNIAVAGERGAELEVESKARVELAGAAAAGAKESNPLSVLSPSASALVARERADQLQGAWIEWWAFALADHHVIPAGAAGTFGRSAALRALRPAPPASSSSEVDESDQEPPPHIWDGSRSIHASCSKPADAFTTAELQADGGRWVQKTPVTKVPNPSSTKTPASTPAARSSTGTAPSSTGGAAAKPKPAAAGTATVTAASPPSSTGAAA